jgi:hypothetical protein
LHISRNVNIKSCHISKKNKNGHFIFGFVWIRSVQNGSNWQIWWTDISNSRIQARRAWFLSLINKHVRPLFPRKKKSSLHYFFHLCICFFLYICNLNWNREKTGKIGKNTSINSKSKYFVLYLNSFVNKEVLSGNLLLLIAPSFKKSELATLR